MQSRYLEEKDGVRGHLSYECLHAKVISVRNGGLEIDTQELALL